MHGIADSGEAPIYRLRMELMVALVALFVLFGGPALYIYLRSADRPSWRGALLTMSCAMGVGALIGFLASKVIGRGSDGQTFERPCDSSMEDKRYAWLVSQPFPDYPTPHDFGFRVGGFCTTEVESRNLSCDESDVMKLHGDDPWLQDARKVGFTTYVCAEICGVDCTRKRVKFDLSRLLASNRRSGPVVQPIVETEAVATPAPSRVQKRSTPPAHKPKNAVGRRAGRVERVGDDPDRYAFGLVEKLPVDAQDEQAPSASQVQQEAEGPPVPARPDRAAIAAGVARVQERIAACGRTAAGRVTLAVTVGPSGGALAVAVVSTTDRALGDCASAAMSAARFAETREGGTFRQTFVVAPIDKPLGD